MTLVSGRPGYSLAWSLGAAGPLLDDGPDLRWQGAALCAQSDPEAWFPEKGGSTRGPKRTCRQCPVRAECLDFALGNREQHGIWGGLVERELLEARMESPRRPATEIIAAADEADSARLRQAAAKNARRLAAERSARAASAEEIAA
jgi:WhiB family redox-sensing transcriptional regulator